MKRRQLKILKIALEGAAVMAIGGYIFFEVCRFAIGLTMIIPFFSVAALLIYYRNKDP